MTEAEALHELYLKEKAAREKSEAALQAAEELADAIADPANKRLYVLDALDAFRAATQGTKP